MKAFSFSQSASRAPPAPHEGRSIRDVRGESVAHFSLSTDGSRALSFSLFILGLLSLPNLNFHHDSGGSSDPETPGTRPVCGSGPGGCSGLCKRQRRSHRGRPRVRQSHESRPRQLRVSDTQRLAEIVGGDKVEQLEDAHCVLITNPADGSWEDPALEKLHLFCEESRHLNDWLPEINLPGR
uniref:Growth arrest and DNA damage inducible gamma n=1 Tax=Cynoglossus semilaevis TaxID=244447 RepID=A0A3P8WNR8_CYNSE